MLQGRSGEGLAAAAPENRFVRKRLRGKDLLVWGGKNETQAQSQLTHLETQTGPLSPAGAGI